MLKEIKSRSFSNGVVYLLNTEDGYPVETTDTFLPWYTKDAIGMHQNDLVSTDVGSRSERWMIGVSTMSSCPVRCKFCATGKLKKFRNLTSSEMIDQVLFVIDENNPDGLYFNQEPNDSKEFKINWTRMGEPFLNIENVRKAIEGISRHIPNTHHYVSTIGIKDADYSWIEGNITLQISLHSLKDEKRNWLIPFANKATIEELGKIRTKSNLKTTINMTLVDEEDFDIDLLKKYFDPEFFFVKLSPINPSSYSIENNLGAGIIKGKNLI